MPRASLRRICRVLDASRSRFYPSGTCDEVSGSTKPPRDEPLADRVRELAREHPTFGYRRLWVLVRFGDKVAVNLKKVHRLVKILRLQVKQRLVAPPPRVRQQRAVRPRRATSVGQWT